jgi:hypothetical protein
MKLRSHLPVLTVAALGIAGSIFVGLFSYMAGASASREVFRKQLANLVLGPLEPQLELLASNDAGDPYPASALEATKRSLTMALGTVAVEQPTIAALNAGAIAALCLAVRHKDRLLRPGDSISIVVYQYLQRIEVDLRSEAVKRRQTAPATRCAILEA